MQGSDKIRETGKIRESDPFFVKVRENQGKSGKIWKKKKEIRETQGTLLPSTC